MDGSVVWDIATSGSGFVQAVVLAIISGLIARALTPKGKLIWSTSHRHVYSMKNMDGGPLLVETQQLWIQNLGRAAVEELEIVLNYAPQHFEVWNPRSYTASTIENGRLALVFPYLASGEFFTISMLNTAGALPEVVSARSKSGAGATINMVPMRLFPKWVSLLFFGLALFGFASLLWFLFQLFAVTV